MNYKFEPLNMKEHKRCPSCGKLMIKRVSGTLDAGINQAWVWWCNCGNFEVGGINRGMPELEWAKKEWERVNNIKR